jgi:hypothetical protein
MTKFVATKLPHGKRWSKPRLECLGKIADVAGGFPNPTQNVNNS